MGWDDFLDSGSEFLDTKGGEVLVKGAGSIIGNIINDKTDAGDKKTKTNANTNAASASDSTTNQNQNVSRATDTTGFNNQQSGTSSDNLQSQSNAPWSGLLPYLTGSAGPSSRWEQPPINYNNIAWSENAARGAVGGPPPPMFMDDQRLTGRNMQIPTGPNGQPNALPLLQDKGFAPKNAQQMIQNMTPNPSSNGPMGYGQSEYGQPDATAALTKLFADKNPQGMYDYASAHNMSAAQVDDIMMRAGTPGWTEGMSKQWIGETGNDNLRPPSPENTVRNQMGLPEWVNQPTPQQAAPVDQALQPGGTMNDNFMLGPNEPNEPSGPTEPTGLLDQPSPLSDFTLREIDKAKNGQSGLLGNPTDTPEMIQETNPPVSNDRFTSNPDATGELQRDGLDIPSQVWDTYLTDNFTEDERNTLGAHYRAMDSKDRKMFKLAMVDGNYDAPMDNGMTVRGNMLSAIRPEGFGVDAEATSQYVSMLSNEMVDDSGNRIDATNTTVSSYMDTLSSSDIKGMEQSFGKDVTDSMRSSSSSLQEGIDAISFDLSPFQQTAIIVGLGLVAPAALPIALAYFGVISKGEMAANAITGLADGWDMMMGWLGFENVAASAAEGGDNFSVATMEQAMTQADVQSLENDMQNSIGLNSQMSSQQNFLGGQSGFGGPASSGSMGGNFAGPGSRGGDSDSGGLGGGSEGAGGGMW